MTEQLALPFTIDAKDLSEFLDRYAALEDEIERLKAEQLECKAVYEEALPMRAVLTALKIVRARRKLEKHPKEPMKLIHQAYIESLVETHFIAQETGMAEAVKMAEELKAAGVTVTIGHSNSVVLPLGPTVLDILLAHGPVQGEA